LFCHGSFFSKLTFNEQTGKVSGKGCVMTIGMSNLSRTLHGCLLHSRHARKPVMRQPRPEVWACGGAGEPTPTKGADNNGEHTPSAFPPQNLSGVCERASTFFLCECMNVATRNEYTSEDNRHDRK